MHIKRVKKLSPSELNQIVKFHSEILTESFLNNFGPNFLKIAYQTIIPSNNNICLIITENQTINGFSVATLDGGKFNSEVINQSFLSLSWQILKSSIKNPNLLIKIINWKLKTPHPYKIKPELQFIAVDPRLQGQGWGTKLIKQTSTEFKNNGISSFRVGTKSSNPQSNSFYKKLGFKSYYQDNFFGDDFNYYLSPLTNH